MTGGDLTATSKFLSYVLRHNPAAIGISLDQAGWIPIGTLLSAAARHGHPIDPDTLTQLTTGPGKRRFETREGEIRAAQGHTIPIDLGLDPSPPPVLLYHGTRRPLPASHPHRWPQTGETHPCPPLRGPRHHRRSPRPPGHPGHRRRRPAPARTPVLPRRQRGLAHQPHPTHFDPPQHPAIGRLGQYPRSL